jgi:hypothetical protein
MWFRLLVLLFMHGAVFVAPPATGAFVPVLMFSLVFTFLGLISCLYFLFS